MQKKLLLPLFLFIITFLSVLLVGAMQTGVKPLEKPEEIYKGLPFALTLMLILLCHELAHYIASRKHGVEATLPYFIPAPTLFGTLGAFIKMKSPISTRVALLDIGAAGPIAGFLISVIVSIIGLSLSRIVTLAEAEGGIRLGDSLIFTFLSGIILDYHPAYQDVSLHPVAFAGWIGFFVTSINLIPVGQLDGGHIAYALFGERHIYLSNILIPVLLLFGLILWEGWALWALLLIVLGRKHPPILNQDIPLDSKRRFLGWLSFVILILTFIPVPFKIL